MIGPDIQEQSLKTKFSHQELQMLSLSFTVDSNTKIFVSETLFVKLVSFCWMKPG